MNIQEENLIHFLSENDIMYEKNVSLKKKTWIHRGGEALFFITPKTTDELIKIGQFFFRSSIVFDLIGHTSNVYIKNDYNPFAVISTSLLKQYQIDEDIITCECGVQVSLLARECVNKNIRGLEGLVGLPGTVGGAVYNNSSCFGSSLSAVLKGIDLLYENGELVYIDKADLHYSHRNSDLKSGIKKGVITRIYLKNEKSDSLERLRIKAEYVSKRRAETQEGPSYNLGSVYAVKKYKKISYKDIPAIKMPQTVYLLFLCLYNKFIIKDSPKVQLYKKKLWLYLYDAENLDSYISNKNINCFLWKKENADIAFLEYQCLMKKITEHAPLEIEVKSEGDVQERKRMKIGIMTVHKSGANYGAALQCYALWKFIMSQGYDCEVIDLLRPCHENYTHSSSAKTLKHFLTTLIIKLRNRLEGSGKIKQSKKTAIGIEERLKRFTFFNDSIAYSRKYRSVKELYKSPPAYDLFISGSDQIWNPNMPFENAPYFLSFAPVGSCKISYASSFGLSTLPNAVKKHYAEWLLTYDKLSVRETQGRAIVKDLINKEAEVVLDPTFLVSSVDWKSGAKNPNVNEPYILLYTLSLNNTLIDYAKKIAQKDHLKLYLITSNTDIFIEGVSQIVDAGPNEWLGWIQCAQYVVTDSFHGTVFSLLMERQFKCYINSKNHRSGSGSRLISLLSLFSLEKCCLNLNSDNSESFSLFDDRIDYTCFATQLEIERSKSIEYLLSSLSVIKKR